MRVFVAVAFTFTVWSLAGTEATADCIGGDFVPDMPECFCFIDSPEWFEVPSSQPILDVAEQTVGISSSCVAAGGQAYWQIQLHCLGPAWAHFAAHNMADFLNDNPRQAWCTEVVAYWHYIAGMPYPSGYASPRHPSAYVKDAYSMRNWYLAEEDAEDGRGRWIEGDRIVYEGFRPGIDGPCPGAYQMMDVYDTVLNDWIVVSIHSQLVDTVCIWLNDDSVVSQIDVSVIDGNIGYLKTVDIYNDSIYLTHVRGDEWYKDIRRYTTLGGQSLSDDYSPDTVVLFRGWGIDLDTLGNPIYDTSRVITKVAPFFPGFSGQAAGPPDTGGFGAFASYIQLTGGTIDVSSNSMLVGFGGAGVPLQAGQSWYIPQGSHPIDGPVTITVDLLADHPYPVRGVTINWKDGRLPVDWEVWWSAETGPVYTNSLHVDTAGGPPQAPNGDSSVPCHVGFNNEEFIVRYVHIRLPNPVPEDYRINGFHFQFAVGQEDDGPDGVFLDTHPDCDCGQSWDPHGDITRDGNYDVVDVVSSVNYAFRSAPLPPREVTCRHLDRADNNCDEMVNIVDVIKIINVAFRGANPASEFCNPCP